MEKNIVSILAFANDIVIIANSEKELLQILKCVETLCKNWRSKGNTEKTNIVHCKICMTPPPPPLTNGEIWMQSVMFSELSFISIQSVPNTF